MITATNFIPKYLKQGEPMLKNYKTYLCALGIAIVSGAHFLGYIPDALSKELLTLLAAGSIAAIRSAIGALPKV